MTTIHLLGVSGVVCALFLCCVSDGGAQPAAPTVTVEIEEDVYEYTPPENGSDPLWAYGSSCIGRVREAVFISATETLAEAKPLNNIRWVLYQREADGWRVAHRGNGRTREPCPLAVFSDGSLFLSDNPTLTSPDERAGPARPELLRFRATDIGAPPERLIPVWEGQPEFTEHSYRSFAADPDHRELMLFQNVGYTHAEWTFLDRSGNWSAHGKLKWPWGSEYPEPQPIRVCYPTVALVNRAVYVCGVSDIEEPYPEWRAYKRDILGQEWDYDFRRLFFTWSDDITTGLFHPWVEVSSRDATCGWIFPNDLWVAPDGVVHLLWTERALDERLRDEFFPGEKQSVALMYARLRNGAVELKRPVHIGGEGLSGEVPGNGRFQVTEDGRLYVFYYVSGRGADGAAVSENRVVGIGPDGSQSAATRVPLTRPFTRFYTASVRSGSAPSWVIDIYGQRAGAGSVMSYARVRLR